MKIRIKRPKFLKLKIVLGFNVGSFETGWTEYEYLEIILFNFSISFIRKVSSKTKHDGEELVDVRLLTLYGKT